MPTTPRSARLRILLVERVEAIGKPAVHRSENHLRINRARGGSELTYSTQAEILGFSGAKDPFPEAAALNDARLTCIYRSTGKGLNPMCSPAHPGC
jgi:hypothetical protein